MAASRKDPSRNRALEITPPEMAPLGNGSSRKWLFDLVGHFGSNLVSMKYKHFKLFNFIYSLFRSNQVLKLRT